MIKHTTICSNASYEYDKYFLPFLNAILSAYEWETGSAVTSNPNYWQCYGTYYFTSNSYIKIYLTSGNNYQLNVDIITPNTTKNVFISTDSKQYFSLGKTSKGICICAYSGARNSRDPHFYNLYIGEITLLDGTTTKGCIYVNDDNSYIVATDKGISEESAFVSTIDNTRKAQLVAAADSTTGAIFNDIYMMFNTPLQYNKMKILGTGKTFLLGKSLCLAD